MNFMYQFPAVKGIQAGKEYYIAMVPMKYLVKLFSSIEAENFDAEFRAQRKLNEQRIPEISEYILNNRNSYVFSALSASIDGDFGFKAINNNENLGILEVSMDAIFLINDGQHRRAALEIAIREDESIGNETISIVFFKDKGLIRSQQMFSDLNKHAVKTSNSLSTLYNSRDSLAILTKDVINNIEFFYKYTDKEKDILGRNSSKMFTLNNIYKANSRIIRKKEIIESDKKFLLNYWQTLSENIVEWNELLEKAISKKDIRENYIITLSVVLNAFGRLGAYFYENKPNNIKTILKQLKKVDWLRSARDNWEYRTIRPDGKIVNNEEAVILTCNKIKQILNIKLSKDELLKEKQLLERKSNV